MIEFFRKNSLGFVDLNDQFNGLSLRERFFILLSVFSVIYLLWFFLFGKNIKEDIDLLHIDNVYI